MEEVDECWQFETGSQQYPKKCVSVQLDYVPDHNRTAITVWGGKRTVVASSLSFMWSSKYMAQHIS